MSQLKNHAEKHSLQSCKKPKNFGKQIVQQEQEKRTEQFVLLENLDK